MPPHADRLTVMGEAGDSAELDGSFAVSYRGPVTLSEPTVPQDFTPSLTATADPGMFVDANGRKKRVWLLTVAPGTSAADLEGAKLKKTKCTTAAGTQFRVTTRHKKDHVAVIMNRDLESVAVRTRIAGSVVLNKQLEIPGIRFEPTGEKRFPPTEDAHQRYVPFGASTPAVHSRSADELCAPPRKKKKKSHKRRD